MVQQLVLRQEMVLSRQPAGTVLQLGGPQAPVPGIILPVHIGTPISECLHLRLYHGGVDAGIGIQRLFNVDNKSLPALFTQGQGNEPVPVKHTAPQQPRLVRHGQHFLRQLQLPQCAAAGIGKFRGKIHPEPFNGRCVPLGADGAEIRLRPLGAEFFDVVPLAGIPPPRKKLQILFVVEVVPPCADIADADIGVPGQQHRGLALRHDGYLRLDAVFKTVALNGCQGGVLISLRSGHRVIKGHPALTFTADNETACRLRPRIVQCFSPHELHTGGILAQLEAAAFIIAPQRCRFTHGNGFECQHKSSFQSFFFRIHLQRPICTMAFATLGAFRFR